MNKLRKIVIVIAIIGLAARAFRGAGDNGERELQNIAAKFERGEFEEGVEQLAEFVENHPDDEIAWTMLGNAYLGLDQNENAEEAFRNALAIDRDMARAAVGLGVTLRQQGEIDEAQKQYEHAIDVEPTYAIAHSSLAVIYLIQKDNKNAIRVAEKAAKLDPNNPTIFANLCMVYHQTDQFGKRDLAAAEAKRLGYSQMKKINEMMSEK